MSAQQSSFDLFTQAALAPEAPGPETQCADILAALQAGERLTHRDVERRFGCTRLAARIYDLKRMGHAIQSEWLHVGPRCKISRYFMP